MKTFGLGKDGRRLSLFQSKSWMDLIAANRKYENMPRGEKSARAKLKTWQVLAIRKLPILYRYAAQAIGSAWNVHPSYLWHLRARKKWKHI